MRQRLGDKKLRQLREKFRRDFIYGDVRGNTNHAKCLYTRNGDMYILDKHGNLTKCTNPPRIYIAQELSDHWPEINVKTT